VAASGAGTRGAGPTANSSSCNRGSKPRSNQACRLRNERVQAIVAQPWPRRRVDSRKVAKSPCAPPQRPVFRVAALRPDAHALGEPTRSDTTNSTEGSETPGGVARQSEGIAEL
jgi:hypothetical protein